MEEIRTHEWFMKNLPADLMRDNAMDQFGAPDQPTQSVDEIMQIIAEATIPPVGANNLNQYLTGSMDMEDDMDEDLLSDCDLDIDRSREWQVGEFVHCWLCADDVKVRDQQTA